MQPSLETIGSLWSQGAPQIPWGALLWRLPLLIALFFLVLITLLYVSNKKTLLRKTLFFCLFGGMVAIVISAVGLSWIQYIVFKSGPLKYALPPYKPLSYYYLQYALLTFWAQWVVGFLVTLVVSAYWWFIKKQSQGMRINTEEILVFVLFGSLSAWPGILVFVATTLILFAVTLLYLNIAGKFADKKFIFGIFKELNITAEIRVPIAYFFLVAAPVALLFSPWIFKVLGLGSLIYIIPRSVY